MFVLLIVGTIFVPVAAFIADKIENTFASASLPFVTLVIMVGFMAEQHAIIRAGRYLKEHIETRIQGLTTWEAWLQSNRHFRDVDRYFFASFLLVFMIFYAAECGLAINRMAMQTWYPEHAYYAAAGYGVAAIWLVVVTIRHWNACTTTDQ